MVVRERRTQFPYDVYMEREGLPVYEAVAGVDDVTALPRKPWARLGGRGTFIQLQGTFESERGIYVADIPGSGALNPEKHLYEKAIFVLQGRGLTEVWQGEGPKITFEWGEGSVFAIPQNLSHRLINGSRQPVIFMAVTTAPQVINALGAHEPVFQAEVRFLDLYRAGGAQYFAASDVRTKGGWYDQIIWHTNFIPDCRGALLDDLERKVSGGQLTGYRMGREFPHGHISQWPSGRYHKAHYHGPGATLLGLDGEGYVLVWDSNLGARPYQSGHGDQVMRIEWGRNSIYSPPNGYFHMHFNTGPGPAKHIAVYGAHLPLCVDTVDEGGNFRGSRSFREGGTLIEYEDEDPQIRKEFEDIVRSRGIRSEMPPVTYRDL